MARTQGHGNPKWSRDETILALDLYLDLNGNIPARNDERVRGLSRLLRDMPFQRAADRRESFRNADGVVFKLQNIRSVATGRGLSNVSETDRRVWAEFGADREGVKTLANNIRRGIAFAESLPELGDGSEDFEFKEGRVLTEVHRRRERNPKVRRQLLALRRRDARLKCEMCGRLPNVAAPKFEDAIFEAHHLLPIAMTMERTTRLRDLALLCASCHRLLHRAISVEKHWLGIAEALLVIGLQAGGPAGGER
jgi:5-methylcytosine-specific restriction protein A